MGARPDASARGHVLEDDGDALAHADAQRGHAPPLTGGLEAAGQRAEHAGAGGPEGWPIAIAPPQAFTISGSTPQASVQARDWAAKASLSSTAATSFQPIPARDRARFTASTGA